MPAEPAALVLPSEKHETDPRRTTDTSVVDQVDKEVVGAVPVETGRREDARPDGRERNDDTGTAPPCPASWPGPRAERRRLRGRRQRCGRPAPPAPTRKPDAEEHADATRGRRPALWRCSRSRSTSTLSAGLT